MKGVSADLNGTWHSYSIVPSSNGGWGFLFDGKEVSNINFKPSSSESPVFVVAEQVTTVVLARLGPVEFRNISYLTTDGWHQTSSLTALVGCGLNTPCTLPDPFGILVSGPNYVIAGSYLEQHKNGELLWTRAATKTSSGLFESLPFGAGPIVVLGLVVLFILYIQFWYRRGTEKLG